MISFKFLAGAATVAALAAPAAAQYYPQQGYPQQSYPQQYQQYPQYPQQQTYPGYGTNQGYTGNPVTDVIDQLLGNRYSISDRQAVRQCARAAMTQAQSQYGSSQYGGGYGGYGQQYGRGYGQQYGQGYNRYGAMRVSAITDVQRRPDGLRVTGTLSSGGGYGGGYANQGYAAGNLSFRCTVDYRGAVTGLRIRPYSGYRGY